MNLFKWKKPDPTMRHTILCKVMRDGLMVGTVLFEKRPRNYRAYPQLILVSLSCGGSKPDSSRMDRFEAFDEALTKMVYPSGVAVNPLVVMVDGRRSWFVYAKKQPGAAENIRDLTAQFEDCDPSVTEETDPRWERHAANSPL